MAYIQIVDDNARARTAMSRHLASQGHRVCEAESADEALGYLKAICFDLVIVDYRLHNSNGVDVLSYVQWFSPNTRKLLITGYPSEDVLSLAERLGAVCLLKPFGLGQLDARLAEFDIRPPDDMTGLRTSPLMRPPAGAAI